VLDEADQLLSDNFYADVAWLLQQLPSRKQVGRLQAYARIVG
jgi:superfamily II DNA/RNA helicase